MVDTVSDFQQIFLTYKDVKEAHPNWTDAAIEDYLATKRDLSTATNISDSANVEIGTDPYAIARLNQLYGRAGSGNFLTSDETGFTVDTEKLTVDMDEA